MIMIPAWEIVSSVSYIHHEELQRALCEDRNHASLS